jgi:hypothetical protein
LWGTLVGARRLGALEELAAAWACGRELGAVLVVRSHFARDNARGAAVLAGRDAHHALLLDMLLQGAAQNGRTAPLARHLGVRAFGEMGLGGAEGGTLAAPREIDARDRPLGALRRVVELLRGGFDLRG